MQFRLSWPCADLLFTFIAKVGSEADYQFVSYVAFGFVDMYTNYVTIPFDFDVCF